MRIINNWPTVLASFFCIGGCVAQPVATSSSGTAGGAVQPVSTTPSPSPTPEEPVVHPKFDSERAFADLKKQCAFGPRYVGSDGHEKCREFLVSEMKKYADETITQEFKYRDLKLANVVGVFHPSGKQEASAAPILILAHWDTRPVADGPNSTELKKGAPFRFANGKWNRLAPIPGASDGASGVAVALELARLFHEKKPTVGILIALVDGEDYGDFGGGLGSGDGVLLGSEYFAKNYSKTPSFGAPFNGILLDMVGAKNLIIPKETNSQTAAPGMNDKIFSIAQALQYSDIFRYNETHEVMDDHTPLNREGIPTVDLIHSLPFNQYETRGFVYWHTLEDKPENCNAKSLKAVGDTVAEVIYREK